MWLRCAVLALTLASPCVSLAATFPINFGNEVVNFSQDILGGGHSALYVYNNLDRDVYAIAVVLPGVTSFTFAPDNVWIEGSNFDPALGGLLAFGNYAGPLVPAHSGFLLGTAEFNPLLEWANLEPGDMYALYIGLEAGTLFDEALNPIPNQTFFGRPCDSPHCAPTFEVSTPEPAHLGLIVAAAALMLTHRSLRMRRAP